MEYFLIFLGSGFGGIARYALAKLISQFSSISFPFGTLAANLVGCFLIGFLNGLFENFLIKPELRIFLFIGILGGFTTFSSFGFETFNLFKSKEYFLGLLNIFLNVFPSLLLVVGGYLVAGILVKK